MTEKRPYDRYFQTSRKKARSQRKSGGWLEFFIILAAAFVLVFGIVRPFVFEAFYIPSKSMVPTLEVGDRVLVNKFIYDFTQPKRGQVVVFKNPENPNADPLIKRIVGLPGDTIRLRDGKLYVNGVLQREPYVNKATPDPIPYGPKKVPPGHVFVMGDNRGDSEDSRYFGAIPESSIEGEAFLRFWPPGRVGDI